MDRLHGRRLRRSHTKSRTGCETCKRRHIRCDENFPHCRNCTRHNCRCDYMNMHIKDDRAATSRTLDVPFGLDGRSNMQAWQETPDFPFPDLEIFPAFVPELFSFDELHLLHHVACIPTKLKAHDTGNLTIWADQIPPIGTTYDFVMHELLALSSTHITWMTECSFLSQLVYMHQEVAPNGLQEAIGVFSSDNSDAVLAASLLLSGQATE